MYDDRHRQRFNSIPVASHKGKLLSGQKIYPVDSEGNFIFTKTHNHKDFEIILIKSGKGVFVADSDMFEFKRGDIIVINPYEIHTSVAFKENLPLEFYCITFDLSIIGGAGTLKAELEGADKKFENFLSGEKYKDIAALFEKLETAFEEKKAGWEFFVSGYLHRIFGEMIESGLCREHGDSKGRRFVKNVQKYIEENYEKDIKSSDVADALSYDRSYFCRLFRKNFGQSFGEYLGYYRINIAKELLVSGKSVIETAMESGFNNLSYFTKVFKNHTGVLPSRYAKNLTVKHN